jgi:hypothetical protein
MKKLMLWASGIVLPFLNPTTNAQANVNVNTGNAESTVYTDTLTVKLKGNNQLMIIGKSLKELTSYADKADGVKTTFLTDVTKAYQAQSIYNTATEVYYFYNSSTSRRIKSETATVTDAKVNVAYEQYRIINSLPKFHYTIYDLENGVELQVYMSTPDSLLAQLGEISLSTAIKTVVDNKRAVRRFQHAVLSTDNNTYKLLGEYPTFSASIEIAPYVGATLIGGNISPVLGASAFYRHTNKYGRSLLKVGGSLNGFTFMTMSGTDISKVSLIQSYDVFFAFNLNSRTKGQNQWFGMQGGILKAPNTPVLNNAYKVGFLVNGIGNLDWTLDLIKTKGMGTIYGLTVKMPF